MRFILACLTMLMALPAPAQVVLGDHHVFQTRHGELQVIGGEVDNYLTLIETNTQLLYGQRLWIRGAWARADETADWVLVTVETFNNPCPEAFQILRMDAGQVSLSAPVEACGRAVTDVTLPGGAMVLSFSDGTGHSFDGTTLQATAGQAAPTPTGLTEHRPATADRLDRYTTRFGTFQVENRGWSDTILRLNGAELPGIQDAAMGITGAWSAGAVDWVLVDSNHMGNMCPYALTLIRLSAAGPQISPAFGECLGGPMDVRVSETSLQLSLNVPDLTIAHRRFTFDGTNLTSTDTPAAIGQGNPAASDPRQWVGQHPARLFDDPNEQARFLTILTPDQLEILRTRIGPANNVIEQGGWVLGRGCQPHACNSSAGVWGIRIADGAPAAAILGATQPAQLFGEAFDPVFQAHSNEAYRALQ